MQGAFGLIGLAKKADIQYRSMYRSSFCPTQHLIHILCLATKCKDANAFLTNESIVDFQDTTRKLFLLTIVV